MLKKGEWYCVEQYCKMNTPGKKDGIIRAWIDGKEVFEKRDIRMRQNNKLKIELIWFNFYHGGPVTAPKDCLFYIDDVVISSEYIGP